MRKLFLLLMGVLLFSAQLFSQTRTIVGKVTDEKGNPIPNASVIVKGSTTGTTTDADGTFRISVPANAKTLVFTAVGRSAQEVSIGTKNSISVGLQPEDKALEEVVVTGIKNVKKSEYAGAASKIDAKQIQNQPVGSFDQVLQGKVPGALALTSSGQPGNNTTIIIRGQGTITGSSSPLYIVDGIPVEAGAFQNFNPNDFASMDVLRDASATALYGSRGSAGVIVITTKRGAAGKVKVTYSGQAGVKSKPEFAFTPMNTTQLLKAQEDYGKIVGSSASTPTLPGWYYSPNNPRYNTLSPAQQQRANTILDSISRINTNWSDEVFRDGSFNNHQISVSGGTGKTRVYSSIALYNEKGTTLRTDMSRVTLRNNVDYGDDRLTLQVSSNLGYTRRNFQQSSAFNTSNPFASSALAVPYHVVRKPNGDYATGTGTKFVATNNLDQTYYDKNYNNQLKATLGVTASYKITPEITAALTTGIDFRETQATNYGSKLVYTRTINTTPTGKAGFQTESLNRFFQGDVRPSLTYHKVINNDHDLEVTAMGEYMRTYQKGFNFQGFGTDPKRPNTPAAIQQGNADNQLYSTVGGLRSTNALLSGLGIARYTFQGKYSITGSYRYDGSSKLPKDTRWQDFYSVGATWEASKEDFIRNISFINTLRLRASYGGSGNADNFPDNTDIIVGNDYPYQQTYTQGSYSGLPTITATYPGNPEMKWETTWVTNLGLDFQLLNRRLYGDLNFYDRRTKDVFVAKKLSATAGFGNGFTLNVNAGEIQNKGFEWNINGEVLRTRDLVWTLFATGSYNKNEVISLGGESSFETGTELVAVGKPLGSHYEVKWGGVDAATGAPLYYTKDGKLTTVYSGDDAVQEFGTWEAPWKGGFGTSLSYKGFDLSVLFSWQQGGNKVDNLEYFLENPGGFLASGYNQSADLNMWKQPGDIATTPKPTYSVNFSSKIIHDASFLRLREVVLSYSLQKNLLEKIKFISNARFYVQGNNLYIWTKWRGRDPEAGATNLNISEFPNPRAITGGLEITF